MDLFIFVIKFVVLGCMYISAYILWCVVASLFVGKKDNHTNILG